MTTPDATSTEITICTRGLLKGHDTITIADYEAYPGVRAFVDRDPQWQYSDTLFAWVYRP